MIQFTEFEKIARLSRPVIITEKLDGANMQIKVLDEYEVEGHVGSPELIKVVVAGTNYYIAAGSRSKWLTYNDDYKGFFKWVLSHDEELVTGLGVGTHFGEWWGLGIARGYGLTEKRFSLFNTSRWNDTTKPACCHVVPVLGSGEFDTEWIQHVLGLLEDNGSVAAPGFMNPEGIVIYHTAAGIYFKKTIKNDESPKNLVKNV